MNTVLRKDSACIPSEVEAATAADEVRGPGFQSRCETYRGRRDPSTPLCFAQDDRFYENPQQMNGSTTTAIPRRSFGETMRRGLSRSEAIYFVLKEK